MPAEKERNNKHIRILLEIVAMVALCVAGFVIVRERSKVNADNIVKNSKSIEKNGKYIEELVKMRADDLKDVAQIKVDIGKIDVKQQAIKEGIARIEKKL